MANNSETIQPAKNKKKITLWKKIIFSSIIILLFLGLLELSTRGYCWYKSLSIVKTKVFKSDMLLHHVMPPNTSGTDGSRSIPYKYNINSQGWHEDYDIELEKPKNCFRIFYVGDSNTHGVVGKGKKMIDIVENSLNIIYTEDPVFFEVINTGTSSYSPILYYLLIREKLIHYDPDLIVVNVDMTDVVNDAAYEPYARYDVNGKLIACSKIGKSPINYKMTPRGLVKLKGYEKIFSWLIHHSSFAYNLHKMIKKHQLREDYFMVPNVINADWLAHKWNPQTVNNVNKSMMYLVQISEFLKKHKVKLVVTGVPHHPQFTGKWSTRPHEIMGEVARKYHFQYFNSYSALESKVKGTAVDVYYWKTDPTHFNIQGNKIWADVQLKYLTNPQNKLLPSIDIKKDTKTAVSKGKKN